MKRDFEAKKKEISESYTNALKYIDQKIGEKPNEQNEQSEKEFLFSNVEIRVINNYTEFEVNLPTDEILAIAGYGASIIANKQDGGGAIGLKIIDYIVDIISEPDKTNTAFGMSEHVCCIQVVHCAELIAFVTPDPHCVNHPVGYFTDQSTAAYVEEHGISNQLQG